MVRAWPEGTLRRVSGWVCSSIHLSRPPCDTALSALPKPHSAVLPQLLGLCPLLHLLGYPSSSLNTPPSSQFPSLGTATPLSAAWGSPAFPPKPALAPVPGKHPGGSVPFLLSFITTKQCSTDPLTRRISPGRACLGLTLCLSSLGHPLCTPSSVPAGAGEDDCQGMWAMLEEKLSCTQHQAGERTFSLGGCGRRASGWSPRRTSL